VIAFDVERVCRVLKQEVDDIEHGALKDQQVRLALRSETLFERSASPAEPAQGRIRHFSRTTDTGGDGSAPQSIRKGYWLWSRADEE
jgi:hypothetical protein